MDDWVKAKIEYVIGRITVHDGAQARHRDLTPCIPQLEETAWSGNTAEMKMERVSPLRLNR